MIDYYEMALYFAIGLSILLLTTTSINENDKRAISDKCPSRNSHVYTIV